MDFCDFFPVKVWCIRCMLRVSFANSLATADSSKIFLQVKNDWNVFYSLEFTLASDELFNHLPVHLFPNKVCLLYSIYPYLSPFYPLRCYKRHFSFLVGCWQLAQQKGWKQKCVIDLCEARVSAHHRWSRLPGFSLERAIYWQASIFSLYQKKSLQKGVFFFLSPYE